MSIHARFDNPESSTCLATAPIVLRFASLFPRDLKRREMHDKRTGGDLTHVRTDLSHLNTQPVGEPDWIERIHAEIAAAMAHNFEEEIAARERKGRFLEAERLRERGPVDPWKFTRGGPLREGIITVHKLWFGGTGHENWDPDRVGAFKQRANDFLLEHFPGGQLREVNIDEDEEALHFHFAIAVWVEKVSQNRGRQWLLQPSANPLLANYEHAQDLAGEAFIDLGIHRGERRAAAARQALAAGVEMPQAPWHVPPSQWRREQRRLALEDRDRIREAARAEAAAIVAGGVALAKSAVKKCRKRAARDAQALREDAKRLRGEAVMAVRSGRLAAAFVRAWTARLETRAEGLAREIAAGTKTWQDCERQRQQAEQRLAQIEQERAGAEAGITQAQETAAGILTTAEARAEEARQVLKTASADRIGAERLAMAAREEASKITQAAEDRAGEIVADATALATETVRTSRKRAIAQARARRKAAERAAAVADREREEAETRAEQARQAQARAQAQREAAEEAAVAARVETVRVQQAAEAEADRILTEAAAAAEVEQARADTARVAKEEAEAARRVAEQAAAEAIRKAAAERAEAVQATARAEVVAAGLAALTREMAAGTLRLRDNGRVTARAPDLLRSAYPEIAPAVRAAATVAEQTRAARFAAEDVTRTTKEEREAVKAEIARTRAAAIEASAKECAVARDELEKHRLTVTSDLDAKRADLDRQETEVKKQWAFLASLLDRFEPLRKKVMRWLSHPDLPASMTDEGIGLAAEALSLSVLRGQVDPDP